MLLEQNQREEYNVSALLTPGLIVNPVPRGMVFSPSHQRISEGAQNFPVALPFQIKTLRQRGELSRVPKSGRWDLPAMHNGQVALSCFSSREYV